MSQLLESTALTSVLPQQQQTAIDAQASLRLPDRQPVGRLLTTEHALCKGNCSGAGDSWLKPSLP